MEKHNHHADQINQGKLPVPRGGTGLDAVPQGHMVRGSADASRLETRTPTQVRGDISAAASASVTALAGRVDTLEQDTGWTELAVGADWNPTTPIEWRRMNTTVFVDAHTGKNATSITAPGSSVIATLPVGARPTRDRFEVAYTFLNGTANVRFFPVWIRTNGTITIYVTNETGTLGGTASVRCSFSFPL